MRVLFLPEPESDPVVNPSTVSIELFAEVDGEVTVGGVPQMVGTVTGETMEVDGVTYFVVRSILGTVTT